MANISIIIATYNRCDDLKACLESLFAVDEPIGRQVEIIIADNNSNDGTKEFILAYKEKLPSKNIHYIFEGRQGKSFALNTAIAKSRGDVIAFSDDDVIFEKDWLVNLSHFADTYDFDAACGRIRPKYPEDSNKWLQENVDLICGPFVSYDYGEGIKPYDNLSMIPVMGANLIAKRYLFDELGGFDTKLGPGTGTFGDDTEISIRWEKNHKKIFYVGTAAVWHPTPRSRMTLKYIADWNKAYGKYTVVKDEGKIDSSIVCVLGVPRYLIREFIGHAAGLMSICFNRRKFLEHWISLNRNIGIIKAYRDYFLCSNKVNRVTNGPKNSNQKNIARENRHA